MALARAETDEEKKATAFLREWGLVLLSSVIFLGYSSSTTKLKNL